MYGALHPYIICVYAPVLLCSDAHLQLQTEEGGIEGKGHTHLHVGGFIR